jgi:hypothetical protein
MVKLSGYLLGELPRLAVDGRHLERRRRLPRFQHRILPRAVGHSPRRPAIYVRGLVDTKQPQFDDPARTVDVIPGSRVLQCLCSSVRQATCQRLPNCALMVLLSSRPGTFLRRAARAERTRLAKSPEGEGFGAGMGLPRVTQFESGTIRVETVL